MSDRGTRPAVAELDDGALVALLGLHQVDAMAELYERHSGRVRDLATEVWGAGVADQVIQDVFGELWRAPRTFDPGRGSVAVHLSMQVRLWEARAGATGLTTGE